MRGLGPLLAVAALLSLLTQASQAAAADGCTGRVVLFQFESIWWQVNKNDSRSADSFVMQVVANTTCNDGFPNAPIRLSDVVLVYTSADQTQVNVIGYGSIHSPTLTFYFPIDVNTIDFNTAVYYVVSATFDYIASAGSEWERGTVKDFVPIQMNGAAKVALQLEPGVIKGHHLEPLNLTRLSHTGNVSLIDCTPASDEEEACYFMTPGQGEKSVCTNQTLYETEERDILICDDTVQFVTVNKETNLDSVQLIYPNGKVAVTLANPSPSLTLELYHYNGTYEACEESFRCQLDLFEPSSETYTFMMVELDNGSPTSSREVLVQDFNVGTFGISHDTAQVSWDSGTDGEFNVTIFPAPEEKFSGRVVNCTEPICDFFFIGFKENFTSYNVSVQRVSGKNFTSEVVTSLAAPPGIISDMLNITTLNHYTVNKNGSTQTAACFQYDNSTDPSYARLLLIDSTGLSVQSSRGGGEHNNTRYCSDSVEVPEGFITSEQTRILVDYGTDKLVTYSAQMDIFLFTPEFQQVSNSTARVTWRNLNWAEYFTTQAPGHAAHEQQLECSYTGDRCYYYVKEDPAGRGSFSLLETSDKLNQSSTVLLEMKEIPTGPEIDTPFSIRQDDDLLQVCFDAVPKADRYELGVELLGELVSSNQAAQTEVVSGKTCAVSSKPVTLGAYEEVWAIVVAYDAGDEILRAGETYYEETFLSPNRFVLVVTSGSTSPVQLRASWYILDDTASFELYNVNLVDASGVPRPKPVVITTTTIDFPIDEEGQYSVCVSVTTPSDTESEQTCSDIITVNFSTDPTEPPAPVVKNVKGFYTVEKNLKVSWERPEDASALLVSWNDVTPRHSGRNERSLRSIETARNPDFTSQKTEARGSSDVTALTSREANVPLPQARSLQKSNDQNRKVTLPNINGNGFTLVPASQSSLDIPLTEGTWNICVSAVKNHQAGTDFCLSAAIPAAGDAGNNPSPPTDLTITDDGHLSWTAPKDDDNITYYIEFDRGSESLSYTTNETIVPVAGVVEAGEWGVSVHSVYKGSLSAGQTITIVLDGIKVTYEQTGRRDVTLSWEETSGSDEEHKLTYTVTLEGGESANTTCSRAEGCSVTFADVQATESQPLNVTVESQNNQEMKKELQIYFLDIESVVQNQMRSAPNTDGSVTVTWVCLNDVDFYNVSLVDKDDVVLFVHRHRTVPCSYTFNETLPTLQDDSVLLQACLNSPGVVRCGDPQRIYLGPDVPGPTTDSSNVLVIVLSSVAAGLLLILMVAGIVYKLRSDRAKRTAGENTSKGGGSVHSLKADSGSQHSVEPPADQPTTAVQANAQNPTQPPAQRQTPVQYRSTVPVSQTQPSNRPIELSINARLNQAAARSPVSSGNPNIRYNGPPQRNVTSNVGPQQLPQAGNPPLQRYASPNVRAAGPLRMNGPASQPRMNNVPSGSTNFSGQPRNLTQGARMNGLPNSQPVEVRGRFSWGQTRAPAPRPTGLQMTASPTRYPPPGQRFAPGPSSPTRVQAPPIGVRPIPRVGGGGYVDMNPSAPGLRPTRSDGRQFSPERAVQQPQPQNPRGQVRNQPDTSRPNYNERIF